MAAQITLDQVERRISELESIRIAQLSKSDRRQMEVEVTQGLQVVSGLGQQADEMRLESELIRCQQARQSTIHHCATVSCY